MRLQYSSDFNFHSIFIELNLHENERISSHFNCKFSVNSKKTFSKAGNFRRNRHRCHLPQASNSLT